MKMTERDIIETYFVRPNNAELSIGDDAAILHIPEGYDLVITMDTLNEGVHFLKDTNPFDIGYKTAAVNLSDLAAMGSTPQWVTLSLSLPTLDTEWLSAFSKGLWTVLDRYHVSLVGGDLNRGPLSATLQAHGIIPRGKALLRSGAKPNDLIVVSEQLGTAALALQALQKKITLDESILHDILPALHRPTPRVELGIALRDIATSAIDLSDGLARDLNNICEKSSVGAKINLDALPMHSALKDYRLALSGGDDYELCFTISLEKKDLLISLSKQLDIPLTIIGVITEDSHVHYYKDSKEVKLNIAGFEHFN
jgi:thiamine-monophosphate kinase